MKLRFFQTRPFKIIVLGVCLLVGAGILRSVATIWQKHGIVNERRSVLEAELAKKERLTKELTEATSSAFVERQARNKLGLIKEGETVVILDTSRVSSDSGQYQEEKLSTWRLWLKLFF